MFQPYHGDNKLHFGEHFNDNMMSILYNHYAEFNFSSPSSLEQESTAKHGVPLRQITMTQSQQFLCVFFMEKQEMPIL